MTKLFSALEDLFVAITFAEAGLLFDRPAAHQPILRPEVAQAIVRQ